jgi:[protein-PII] uridylyltransferase
MQTDPRSLRAMIDARQREIASSHHDGAGGIDTCRALSSLFDEAIRAACDALPPGTADRIAVLALGGYGRAELSPHSDVDVMVLREGGASNVAAGEVAASFLRVLWDAGLDVGHSVRTIDESRALHGTTFDAWTSMLESRPVWGSTKLAEELYDAIRERITHAAHTWFIEGVFDDVRTRHERYGSSVKLLEPNVKKSAGGLRDLHAALWLHRGTDPAYIVPAAPDRPATPEFFRRLQQSGVIDEEGYDAALRAFEFLLRTRHEMHYRRDALHDTLEYALQVQVAEGLGIGPTSELRHVEVYMREYYIHARTIYRLLQVAGQRFREAVEPARPSDHRAEPAGSSFLLYADALSVQPDVRVLSDPRQIFEAFTLAAEQDVDIDLRLRGVLERSAAAVTPDDASSPELAGLFRRILGSRRVAKTLHAMNDADILSRYIPEFGDLVAFFQHNVYHYFTADEHTLIAIAHAEDLRESQGILREVFRNLRRKDILYAALLLHDIAKPRGVATHEIAGVEMSRTILHRLGMNEAFPEVAFLVRNHLVMEQTAFRRNVHDPDTLREFAGKFQKPEQLDQLYVLTYADLSALNTTVWTEWKAAMLQELYRRTSEVLRRNLTGTQIDAYHRERRDEAAESIVDALSTRMPREDVERHLRGMDDGSYLALFSEEEIARHIAAGSGAEPVATFFVHAEGFTEVTVIARDAPFALSRFCAVLAANDANIFDANIFTRDDGLIIDRFRVTGAASSAHLEERTCDKIASDLRLVVAGTIDLDHLFREHHRKWKRRPKRPVNPSIRTDVEFENNPRFTIIDVYAPDTVGFLYRVTETMSELGLDIYFAKIATRMDGIVDAFYTLDRSGRSIADPGRREAIRNALLATLRRLADEGLGATA